MSETKFTQGPWILDWEKNPLLFPFIWQENRFAVAKVCGKPSAKLENTTIPVASLSDFAEPEKVLANAALIAAAPEMYEALINLKECIEDYFGKTEREFLKCCDKDVDGFFAQQYIAACNALKKARGE